MRISQILQQEIKYPFKD